ncbi:helix-turn-helix protein [Cupriavidus metallidurans]|uniref:helix-turn-helix domain-containing protein n=1 Tax=Cupriavidus metallidurans TaxID=119219 RepID=UPI00068EBC27|nr:helix-turn-helix domain-containing protein [Cupriavidus metallidurans]MDE4918302.1 helix-turn-helix domain-containing protein [Cupriavidus metallidurans]
MSTLIMSQCWSLQMPPTPKAVLISLADNANDQGVCWPSIDTIAMRTCFSERAVQNAIKWLETNRLLRAERVTGKSTNYVLTPDRYQPPAGDAPPQEVHPAGCAPTPAAGAPQPPQQMHQPPQEVHPNRKEPPSEPSGNRKRSPARADDDATTALKAKDLIAEGVDRQHAKDWLTLRKAKRLPLTPTAWQTVKDEAAKVGMTAPEAVKYSVGSNWAGFKASWIERDRASAGGSQVFAGQSSVAADWWTTKDGIYAKAAELGVTEGDGEIFLSFRIRVSAKAGEGPWRQHLYREFSRDEGMTERLNTAFQPNRRSEA